MGDKNKYIEKFCSSVFGMNSVFSIFDSILMGSMQLAPALILIKLSGPDRIIYRFTEGG